MEVHFTPDQEAQLAQLASDAGTDVEQLVKDIILRMLEVRICRPTAAPPLPVWHLGALGPFHRRNIYDDVR